MYTLRTITQDNTQINHYLGNDYLFVSRFVSPERFKELYEDEYKEQFLADLDEKSTSRSKSVFGFVIHDGILIPILKHEDSYIMTDSGKTFSCLNKK